MNLLGFSFILFWQSTTTTKIRVDDATVLPLLVFKSLFPVQKVHALNKKTGFDLTKENIEIDRVYYRFQEYHHRLWNE